MTLGAQIAPSVALAATLVSLVHCLPVNGGGEVGGTGSWGSLSSTWVIAVSVCFALTAAILAALGCICCRNESLKLLGTRNGISVPHLPLGNLGQLGAADEVTIFPPAAASSHLAFASQPSLEDKVSFEPLPKIFPRASSSPSKRPTVFRPAHFSGELGKGPASVHDWFDDPQANFPRQQLQYLQELGVGWFGQAVRGEAQNLGHRRPGGTVANGSGPVATTTRVVVKILRSDTTPTEHLCFLHEVQPLRVLYHPNILRLLGRCLESDPFLLILEDSSMDLKAYLLQKREEPEAFLQSGTPLQFACGIASGLDHMHKNNFVHVDLAARNCVLSREGTVKVGDYGTAIQAYKDDYYAVGDVAVPIRWSAPESLHCTDIALEAKELTREANVWSYGVLLWELLSLGALPYETLGDEEVLRRVVTRRDLILQRPKAGGTHADRIYRVATWCWNEAASERPSMHDLRDLLAHLHEQKVGVAVSRDFESRWNALRPDSVREHNLAPDHPAALHLSHLGFESDFVASAPSASLQNLHGSAEDLRRSSAATEEEEDLTSFHISEAIRDLDAILAAESSAGSSAESARGTDSVQRHDSLGNESLDSSRELGSLGFKKSASVEDLLREGPEKVAEMFRITVIDDVDVSLGASSNGEPRSLGASADIWNVASPGGGARGDDAARTTANDEKIWANGSAADEVRESTEGGSDAAMQGGGDVSSDGGGFGGGCTSSAGGSGSAPLPPPAANSVVVVGTPRATNHEDASGLPVESAVVAAAASDAPVLTFSGNAGSEVARTAAAIFLSPELPGAGGSGGSGDSSASFVTANDATTVSEDSSCGVIHGLLSDRSESDTFFLTAHLDGDDTSECSEATLADDNDPASPARHVGRTSTPTDSCPSPPGLSPIRCAGGTSEWAAEETAADSSALSDLTAEEEHLGAGSAEDSLALSEDSFVGEMRRIAERAVERHNARQGGSEEGGRQNGTVDEEDSLSGEYELDDISAVLDREGSPPKRWLLGRQLSSSPICGEEEEIMTVNTLTHEITVRPASQAGHGVIFDGHEVLAGSAVDEETTYEMRGDEDVAYDTGTNEGPTRKTGHGKRSAYETGACEDVAYRTNVDERVAYETGSDGHVAYEGGTDETGVGERGSDEDLAYETAQDELSDNFGGLDRRRKLDDEEDEDTDDTSSTGTSCTTTSGSFECLAEERGSEAQEASALPQPAEKRVHRSLESSPTRANTWDRSATPTKSALRSARRLKASSLRKTVSFNDVISSVYHYTAEEEPPPTPPAAPVPSALAIDYNGLRDWDFQFFLEEEFPEEAAYSSDEEAAPAASLRRQLPVRPGLGRMRTFAPLYCISGLSQEDLRESLSEDAPPAAHAGPPSEAPTDTPQSEDFLVNQKPPWDSSMSDLSCLNGSGDETDVDEESLRSDSPASPKMVPPGDPVVCNGVLENGAGDTAEETAQREGDVNANDFFREAIKVAQFDEANANARKSVPVMHEA
uniref:Protein kinase domain-containing protein n=1 Tax=Ixodes scapularis TaxID=6945 RepID=A0A4D5S0P2_IXOSC